jgi:hypothetical protein
MTDKNRCRPTLDATIRFSIFVAKASLPVDLILVRAPRESLLATEGGRAECTQSTVANYRVATSFTRNLSQLGRRPAMPNTTIPIAQFVSVPHCDAMRSAPRCDKANIVKVGFEAPAVGKMLGPATQRFGIS